MVSLYFIPNQVLVAFLALLSSSSAHNDPTLDFDSCPRTVGSIAPDAPVNSTGIVPFKFSSVSEEEWYLSVTLTDIRSPLLVSQQINLQGYLSMPNTITSGKACLYQFSGVNTSVSGSGLNSCEGVLSQECISLIRGTTFPTAPLLGDEGDLQCQPIPDSDKIRETCGQSIISPGVLSTEEPVDFLNQTCAFPSPPRISILEGYRTIPALGQGIAPSNTDRNADEFVWYDRHIERPIPWVIAASFNNGTTETQVVCVAPDNVQEGSRVPKGDTPSHSAGVSRDWHFIGQLAIATAGVVSVWLTLT